MGTEERSGSQQPEQVDMKAIDVFHFQEGRKNFEDFGQDNGFRFWYAYDLSKLLGYEDYGSFRKAVGKAMAACANLDIPVEENFIPVSRDIGGQQVGDYKLSRFGCYLSAMNGDVRKPKVAQAQAYFAVMAESFRLYLEDANNIERLMIRDEITDREKSLSGVAKGAGVTDYALFQNAGYRGLYNMNLRQLRERKRLPNGKCLLDYMGKTELAANLFRITQTEEKIKNEGIQGQFRCERAAEDVGRKVRHTMQEISGTTPESLPLEADIKETRKHLKQTHRGFKKLDGKKRGGSK